ncbi:MAG: cysteine synthase A [Alphaproteobacteria bacterium]|nr:cysteine synthase A [Alphaproteobacteria bacterium]
MGKLYSSILQTIGNTPVVKVNNMAPEGVNVYVKLEAFNPLGSVKDRLALGVIEAAERDGSLKPGQTVIEATSGNTGIGLAMVCAQKGYPLVVTMAENFSIERRKLMRFLGARVVLTPASEKGSGMLAKARELADQHGWFLCHQFENEANPDMHSKTTAEEILSDFEGEGLDYWVSGYGTGGTLKGVARVLKVKSPTTKVIACEPDNSQLLSSGIAQQYSKDHTPSASHPNFRPHLMQGWTPDFIPKLANDVLQDRLIDKLVPVRGADALEMSRQLARKEGIFCGISGGATFAAAMEIAKDAPAGSNILCMIPDTGERYLSTPLFDGVAADMSDEEKEIAASTPRYRFDVAAEPAKPSGGPIEASNVKPEAREYIDKAIHGKDEPVVMFALEWCEFCWSVRKMFGELGVPYRSIDLDSVPFQENDLGGDIRAALKERTGSPTIPQIFVAGEHIGGCTETFDAFNDGRLQKMLEQSAVKFDGKKNFDAYSFLPGWLHPR